jgi:HEAT repeat protein
MEAAMKMSISSIILVTVAILLACSSAVRQHAAELGSADVQNRIAAAEALHQLGRDAHKALPELILAARDSSPEVRRLAVETMGMIGKPALEGTHVLIAALSDSNVQVRRCASVTITQLEAFPSNAFPAYLRTLGDPDTLVRKFTVAGFLDLGTLGVPTLRRALTDSSALVRQTAALTLGMLGEEATSAKKDLKKATADFDLEVARRAEEALRRIERREQ